VSELARPLVATVLADVARMERATEVATGAGREGRAAFERLLADVGPELSQASLDCDAQAGTLVTSNLWGRVVRLPTTADLWEAPPPSLFTRTAEPAACAAQPAVVELTIDAGVPVAINDIPMSLVELVEVVDTIAGDHGVGRVDVVRAPGTGRVRRIAEAPAAVALAAAVSELERVALGADVAAIKSQLTPYYLALITDGTWHSATRGALDAFVEHVSTRVSGVVRLLLSHGACQVIGRRLNALEDVGTASTSALEAH
jgi:argininosuccinate synthase